MSADFQYKASHVEDPLFSPVMVYVTGDNSGLIKYPKEKWPEMALISDPGARFFCILPGKKLIVYPSDKYAEIEFEDLRAMPNPAYAFDMEEIEKPMESVDDLRAALKMSP